MEDEENIRERVLAARPQILFVAYGAPIQDRWIARNLDRLEVPVCIGVGGSFDYIAGVRSRAPLWLRRLGLEWLHRLITQPWRWRRMLALPRFAWQIFWSEERG
jgi:N-acetylglucosaminyldiphosphoundecaprenol N-acetyl-beta-D-mannosaminyltransferase